MRVDQDPNVIKRGQTDIVIPAGVGPETAHQLRAMARLMDALYETSVITNARAYASTRAPSRKPVTPGTPEKLYTNSNPIPVCIYISLEPFGNDIKNYLYLSREKNNANSENADVKVHGESVEATVVLKQNESLWADISSPDATDTPQTLTYSIIPLQGRLGALGG